MFKKLFHQYAHRKSSLGIRWYSSKEKYILKTEPELITVENQYQVLEDAVTPLARISYEKQLEYKQFFINDVIKDLRAKVTGYTRNQIEILPIVPSPVVDHYRSKDEYNVRMGIDGDPVTYGLFTGKPLDGIVYAVRPLKIRVIKPLHNELLRVFEMYVKKSSLPPCYRLDDGGFWRRVIVRSNLKGETMLVIVNHPRDYHDEVISREEKNIVEHFAAHDCHVDSIFHFLCKHVRADASNSDVSLIHGKPFLYENLLDCKFRISPDSFFQINVKAAEILNQEVLNLAKLTDRTTLLDLGCGVGAFSIMASKRVRNCIGIDSNFTSIEDAVQNATLNEARNCQFIPGNIETRLNPLLKSLEVVTDLVVIANPGRSGLHRRVIEIIRRTTPIRRLVYVSCKPDHLSSKQNFIDLMKPDKEKKTTPFQLIKVKTVDLFPHTYHYEMILVFERK